MIYLDSCALVKLVVDEAESMELDAHLTKHNMDGTVLIASKLAAVEIHRALFRLGTDQQTHSEADELLTGFAKLPVSPMLAAAAKFPDPHLRSLDALQLASACSLGGALTQFITYDRQLGKFATEIGLPVVAPGT